MKRTGVTFVMGLVSTVALLAQNPPPTNPPQGPPTRDPLAAGYVKATELPDGALPSVRANGNSSSAHAPAVARRGKEGRRTERDDSHLHDELG